MTKQTTTIQILIFIFKKKLKYKSFKNHEIKKIKNIHLGQILKFKYKK